MSSIFCNLAMDYISNKHIISNMPCKSRTLKSTVPEFPLIGTSKGTLEPIFVQCSFQGPGPQKVHDQKVLYMVNVCKCVICI